MRRPTPRTLKNCPFCNANKPIDRHRVNSNTVTCRKCGAQVKQSALGMGDAAWRWNRRAGVKRKPVKRPPVPLIERATGLHVVVIEDRSCQDETRVFGPFKIRDDACIARTEWAIAAGFTDAQNEAFATQIESHRWVATVLPLSAISELARTLP